MLEFVIPCLLGLESLVGDEIRKLGLSDVRVENGRVLCRGEARDIARLNINLRCGARVILGLHKFRARANSPSWAIPSTRRSTPCPPASRSSKRRSSTA